jgi:hypothetical protein
MTGSRWTFGVAGDVGANNCTYVGWGVERELFGGVIISGRCAKHVPGIHCYRSGSWLLKWYMNKLKAKNSTNKEENNSLLAENLSWVWVIDS